MGGGHPKMSLSCAARKDAPFAVRIRILADVRCPKLLHGTRSAANPKPT